MRRFVALLGMSMSTALGCASTGFLMAKPEVTSYGYAFPAKDSAAVVDVYQLAPPNKPYLEIGRIRVADTDEAWSMRQVLASARQLGADGVVIVGRAGSTAMAVPAGQSALAVSEDYGLVAIAIRYRGEGAPPE